MSGQLTTYWAEHGPRLHAWLVAALPRRTTMVGVWSDARLALGLDRHPDAIRNWANRSLPDIQTILASLGTYRADQDGMTAIPAPPAPLPMAPASTAIGTLADRLRAEDLRTDRAECPVCALPLTVRQEMAAAKRTYPMARIVAMLVADGYGTVTLPAYQRHVNRRHES